MNATESVLLLKHGKPVRYGRCVVCERFAQALSDRVWCPACELEFKQMKRVNDYTKRGEVMNPPESAAEGSEAGNLNTPHRDGTGVVPGDESMGLEAQAMQPAAAPTSAHTSCPDAEKT